MRVVVALHGMIPLPGEVVTGNGLRAWSLGESLRNHGHEIIYLTRELDVKASRTPLPPNVRLEVFAHPEDMREMISGLHPDVLLICQWEILDHLDTAEIRAPIITDLFAPRLLECQFQPMRLESEMIRWIDCVRKSDGFICSHERQRYYYATWLALAGFDSRQIDIAIAPMCALPFPAPKGDRREPALFVAGGVFWPWQDMKHPSAVLVETMDAAGKGKLVIYGGPYPIAGKRREQESFDNPFQELLGHKRVSFEGMAPHDALLEAYGKASVAFDVMMKNAERELAFSFRDLDYLHAGLPIIVPDHAQIAGDIQSFDAGWVVNPADAKSIAQAVKEAINKPDVVKRKSANARRLAETRYSLAETGRALHALVAGVRKHSRNETLFAVTARIANDSYKERDRRVKEIDELRIAREEITELKIRLRASTEEHESARRDAQEAENEITGLRTETAWMKDKISRLEQALIEKEAELRSEQAGALAIKQRLENDLSAARDIIARREAQLREAGDRAEELSRERGMFKEEAARNKDKAEKLQADLTVAFNQYNRLETTAEQARLQSETDRLELNLRLQHLDQELRRTIAESDNNLRKALAEADGLSRKVTWLENELKVKEGDYLRKEAEARDLYPRIDTLLVELDQVRRERDRLAEELNAIKRSPSYRLIQAARQKTGLLK